MRCNIERANKLPHIRFCTRDCVYAASRNVESVMNTGNWKRESKRYELS